jgi:hypothetical protein
LKKQEFLVSEDIILMDGKDREKIRKYTNQIMKMIFGIGGLQIVIKFYGLKLLPAKKIKT